MKNVLSVICMLFLCSGISYSEDFAQLKKQPWKEVFSDPCTGDWSKKWFLDGLHAKVTNEGDHMSIDTAKGYAVLWTKESFAGDVRIEYDFKRLDEYHKGVNIIYIQATGDGENGCDEDIRAWSDKRKLAAMSDYFRNMHTYHISYAAFGTKNEDPKEDYIRGRRYLPCTTSLKNTKLKGDYTRTGLFNDKQWIHVTIIKRDKEFWMELKHPDKTLLCHFINDDKEGVHKGRIGLRLMPKHLSHFKNVTVMTSGKE